MLTKIKKYVALTLVLVTFFSMNSVIANGSRSKGQSDASYANFRNVRAGRIGVNNLYRSQHPANGSSRSVYANKLAEKYGIRTVVNLSDSKRSLKRYFRKKKISPSYYYRALYNNNRVYTAHMREYHNGSAYRKKVAAGMRFIIKHKGPYLIHCEVGRDRTGYVILLLECLMGAPYDYMVNDYAQSYINVNHYSAAKARAKAITCLNNELHYMTGKSKKTNWSKTDLVKGAEGYLKKCGMTYREITKLKKSLSTSYPAPRK